MAFSVISDPHEALTELRLTSCTVDAGGLGQVLADGRLHLGGLGADLDAEVARPTPS